jgi:CRISPR-associated protein Cmr3
MHTLLFKPMAPLVLRTGKPFGDTGGGDSFPFPLPSTVAGALRTAHADTLQLDFKQDHSRIIAWQAQGALPAIITDDTAQALFPRPQDVSYVQPDKHLILQRLSPEPLADKDEEGCDLPDGLSPAFLNDNDEEKSKPATGPVWWTQDAMTAWLLGETPEATTLGPNVLPIETRTHVALCPETLSARTGQLFQSAGPDFGNRRKKPDHSFAERGWQTDRYGLLARFSEDIQADLLRLGGEGRLTAVSHHESAWPQLPDNLASALANTRRIRLVLATPALFDDGWKPGWIDKDRLGSPPGIPELKLRLCAAVIDRWQAISGWDLLDKKPKAIRRLVPAGSVFWFEVVGEPSADWAKALWLSAVSDQEQDRHDGFGLALPGLWI